MSQPTPGPWTQKPSDDGTQIYIDGPNGYPVCQVNHGVSHRTQSANARLIAAAPRMLEALKETQTAYCDKFCGSGSRHCSRCKDFSILINEIEGASK